MLQITREITLDDSFLYELYVSARIDEFRILELPTQQLDTLLRMQYEAQKQSYQQQFPQAAHTIIHYNEVPIGRIIIDIQNSNIRLVDITLLPNYRGKGIGTLLLQQLQQLAINHDRPILLHVLQGNPAHKLYKNCGFYEIGQQAPYIVMQWNVATVSIKK